MKTYPTYAKAKIDNPDCDIYITPSGVFHPVIEGCITHIDAVKCNPADHCSTVEEFLGAGYKLVSGDLILSSSGTVITLEIEKEANSKAEWDGILVVLRASALNDGSKIPDERCQQDEESDAQVLRRIADKLENQESAKDIIQQSAASVKESPMTFDDVMSEAGIKVDGGIPEKIQEVSRGEFERGMIECCKKIARIVGREFVTNVGYEELPDVVLGYISEHCKGSELPKYAYHNGAKVLVIGHHPEQPGIVVESGEGIYIAIESELKTPEQVEVEELAYEMHKCVALDAESPSLSFEVFVKERCFNHYTVCAKAAIKRIKGE